jgi:hypothetical protein
MQWGVDKTTWHRWYAWRPVRLMNGKWVWLEYVERTSYFNPEVAWNVSYNFRFSGSFVCRGVRDE